MWFQGDHHSTVTHMRVTDDRFPGWAFEIRRLPGRLFCATATRSGVTHVSDDNYQAKGALDDVRARVRAFQAELLAGDVGL